MDKYNDSSEIIEKALTFELVLDTTTESYDLGFCKPIQNENIVGIMMRAHSNSKKSEKGRQLAAATVIENAHITFVDNANSKLISMPLEHLVNGTKDIGRYANVHLNCFDAYKSELKLGAVTGITANDVIEITFLYEMK